jgi:hypothetical protein
MALPVVILALLFLAMGIIFVVKVIFIGAYTDLLFLNACISIGFLFLSFEKKLRFEHFFSGIVLAIFLGGLVDTFLVPSDATIFAEKSYVGGVGNPSSFGLLSNICIAWLLLANYPKENIHLLVRYSLVAILSIFVFRSFSLLAVIQIVIVYGFTFWKLKLPSKAVAILTAICAAIILFPVLGLSLEVLSFVFHKFYGLLNFLGIIEYDTAAKSISLRSEIHGRALRVIAQDPTVLLIGQTGVVYDANDSQILSFILSFGGLITSAFVVLNMIFCLSALKNKNDFVFIALILFNFSFFTNRLLDYFPMAILYFALVSYLSQINRRRLSL